jgi:hypothetical protein
MTQAVDDPAARALHARLDEQRQGLIAAREIFRALDVENDSGLAFAMGAGATTNIRMWMDRFGKLADPPLTVEVEEDDDADDEPTTEEPGAGVSSGRWQPLPPMPESAYPPGGTPLQVEYEAAGAAHLDFAEDAARRARERTPGA